MKRIELIFSLVACLTPNLLMAEFQSSYEIKGRIEGLKEGEKVTMILIYNNGTDEPIDDFLKNQDSAYVTSGEFHLKGVVPSGPRQYWMTFDKHPRYILRLIIDNNEHIVIHGPNIDSMQHSYIQHYVTIEGSPTMRSNLSLEEAVEVYHTSISAVNYYLRHMKDSIGFNGPEITGILKAKSLINDAFYQSIFYSPLDPDMENAKLFFYTEFENSGHASFWARIYKGLNEQQKNSFVGQRLKERALISVGQPFPHFTLPTLDGKMLALKDVIAKSKITIVHFWAENSIQRKEMQEELQILYKKYHDKGLNIIAFSSDKYAEQWKEAVQKYQLSAWYNVFEGKGKEGLVGSVYHEYSGDYENHLLIHNTTNVLIDMEGKILAWDVTGDELQWYLWKQLGE